MELVTSHVGADFDALASMVAARKLYPDSVAAFSGGMDRNVREFVSLFDESLDVRNPTDIKLEDVHRLIVVDTQHFRRLGRFRRVVERGAPVHLYDHHPASVTATRASEWRVEYELTRPLGATTTLLVQILREREVAINAFEATLFALGVYEETGGLIFSHTTVEDVEMAAFLLRRGANLDVVSDYINRSLTEKQRGLLNQLILNAEYHTVQGIRIAIAQAEATEYIDEIALLTHKLCDIENVGAVFALIETGNRPEPPSRDAASGQAHRSEAETSVFLVARSKADAIDVGEILAPLGGGGHHRAASAMLKGSTAVTARERLLTVLNSRVNPQALAANIMEYPVRTVSPDTTVEEAGRVMLRYGYSGLIVVSEGTVAGIVTRRDVDRAKHHRLHTAPVKAVMTTGVPIASPDTMLHELQEMMVSSKVGRIPVVAKTLNGKTEKSNLVGVVTRSGLLQALYGYGSMAPRLGRRTVTLRRENIGARLKDQLPSKLLHRLRAIGEIGDRLGLSVYVVGGFVRDLLLGVANFDVDIMSHGEPHGTDNDGIALARALAEEWNGRLVTHERFGTAAIVLEDGQKIDVATARAEFYKFPAALPEVEYASIQEDLYRRDFTINAMAVQLNRERVGELLDFFGGREDLESGTVRVLHNLSFVEDPTRIIRAVRFEQRYGFHMDGHTEALISQAADPEVMAGFSRLTRERMRDELILLLSEPNPSHALHRMAHLDILKHLHPRLRFDEEVLALLHRVREELAAFDERGCKAKLTRWLLYFLPLLQGLELNEVKALSRDMKLGDRIGQLIASATIDLPVVFEKLNEKPTPSGVRKLLLPLATEVILFAAATSSDASHREALHKYLYDWKTTRADVTGEMLLQRGLKPGPHLGRALEAALDAKLDGRAGTQEEQLLIALKA